MNPPRPTPVSEVAPASSTRYRRSLDTVSARVFRRVVNGMSRASDSLETHEIEAHKAWALLKGTVVAPTAPVTWAVLLAPARYYTVRAHGRANGLPRRLSKAAARSAHPRNGPRGLPLALDSAVSRWTKSGRSTLVPPSRSHRPVAHASPATDGMAFDSADGRSTTEARSTGSNGSARGSVITLDSRINAFISSDLHRTPPGRRDWATAQDTALLYAAILEYYGTDDRQGPWTLIENGDVEDYWMVGGSNWGVAYDIGRLIGGLLGPLGRPLRRAVYGEHLKRIIAHHGEIYERIGRLFHLHGRYARVVGNHDDAYYDPHVAEELRRYFPGVPIADYIALTQPGNPVSIRTRSGRRGSSARTPPTRTDAIITHGHITDPWNGGSGAWRGKTVTWTASLLGDLPGGGELGPPKDAATARTFSGDSNNQLTSLGHWMSLDHNHQTLDESQLHRAFRNHWGEGRGPWLICGHTHTPLSQPFDPSDYSHFRRYLNSGSGIAKGLVSGVEWRGASGEPPLLVGFTFGHPEPDVGDVVLEFEGRDLVRTVLSPGDGDRLLPRGVSASS